MNSDTIAGLTPEFAYLLIGIAVFLTSTRLIQASSSHIFALYITAGVVYYLHYKNVTETLTFNEETKYKYIVLGSPSHFYYDTNLINLFESIYNWRKLNANNFDNAIKCVNNVLIIESDSEKSLQRCVDNYENARDQSKRAINMLHGFVHVLDHPLLIKKLENVLKRLQELLERHLDRILSNCKKIEKTKDSVDVHTRYVEDNKGVKAYDPETDYYFDVF